MGTVAAAVVLIVSLGVAVERLWAVAHDQGRIEAARDAEPGTPKRDGLVPPAAAVVATSGGASAAAPSSAPTPTTAPPYPQSVAVQGVIATATAPPAVTGCNKPVSYEPGLVADGDPTTAWRVPGDGVGHRIQLALQRPTRVLQVGLLPGYARVDPCTKVDRFPQMRRVTAVRWLFDGGSAVRQAFTDDPVTQSLAVDVVTTTVTVEILSTTDGPEIDFTPISEIRLGGVPATA